MSRRISVRTTLGVVALIPVVIGSAGCGAVAVIHDNMVGPISPARRLEVAIRGGWVHAIDDRGRRYKRINDGEPRLRAYPKNTTKWLMAFDRVVRGARRGVERRSLVSHRFESAGNDLPSREQLDELEPGATTPQEAATALGPPDLWLRRADGDLMLWEHVRASQLEIRLGPGPATRFIPVPGIGNLKLDLGFGRQGSERILLLFDPEGRLRTVSSTEGDQDVAPDASDAETPEQ